MTAIEQQYEIVVGLEIHVQLNTRSKAFCSDNNLFGAAPNTQISPISLGHPGTLPVANLAHLENAIKLGLALGCQINQKHHFDRKNYFYPDLPKGYQITQDAQPVCKGGSIKIKWDGKEKNIRLTRIHQEEDAGKSVHDAVSDFSLIDLNRAGVPLLEIVTEPDLRSGDEAAACISEIRKMVRFLDISDGNMEEGSLRCDCNVSVRKIGEQTYGTRCEIKNVNSMRFAKLAIEYEAARQIKLLQAGGEVVQQTRSYDVAGNHTEHILRDKEDAHDYRYFPEPDLPPVHIRDEHLAQIRAAMPALPQDLFLQLTQQHQLTDYEASILTEDRETARLYLALVAAKAPHKAAANLIINRVKSYLNEKNIALADWQFDAEKLCDFIDLIQSGKVGTSTAYQRIFPVLVEQNEKNALQIAQEMGLIQAQDADFLQTIISEVLAKYPDKVAEYKKGKKGLIGFFVGEVVRASKGKADPNASQQMLRACLEA